jgi:8-oxo-dGTP pyrophosphatase MutT (NUDIX family)
LLRSPVHLTSSSGLTRDWILDRLRAAAQSTDDPEFRRYAHPPEREVVPAAVLVPLVNQPEGVTVLLTQRTGHLHDHAGQISFPGGRVDEADADRVATALREAAEEIGIAPSAVEIIGSLPEWDIPTGFRVTPVVGWIEPPLHLSLDAFEVAEVFEVPLAFFLDPANHERHCDEINGRTRNYFAMPYQGRNIWGATAGMLHALYRVLNPGR